MNNPLFDLSGKKAIITGASQGIGKAIAEAMYSCGAEICIIGGHDSVYRAAEDIQTSDVPVHAVMGDLSDRTGRERMFAECLEKLGGEVDILVNNAGINIRKDNALNYAYEDWDKMFAVNVEAVFYFCQFAAREMMKKGYGKIVNTASIAGMRGVKNASVYSATKAAVIHMSEALSNEWSAQGIHVNCVCPGFTETSLAKVSLQNPERMKEVLASLPIGRIGQPSDIAGAVVFLACPASDFITGAHLPVDGGASSCGT